MSEDLLALVRDEGHTLEIARGVVDVLHEDGAAARIEPTPDAFVEWLRSRADLEAGEVRESELAGLPALSVDVRVLRDAFLFDYAATDATYRAAAGQRIRFLIASVDGTSVHVAAEAPSREFERFLEEAAQPLIDSLAFE